MMPAWVREWILWYGGDPAALRTAYLTLGMTDEEYAQALLDRAGVTITSNNRTTS